MRHRCKRRILGGKARRREALLRDLVKGLILHNRIRTTVQRAKAAKQLAEHVVTIAKEGTLHARRLLIAKLHSPQLADRLIREISPLYSDIKGGYTRLIHLNFRPGDGANMALLEFTKVPQSLIEAEEKRKKRKKEQAEKKTHRKKEEPLRPKAEEAKKLPREEKKEKKPPKRAEEKPKEEQPKEEKPKGKPGKEVPKEEKYRGPGFLGGLRRFLKGEEK
ncbi:MAG: 50S ribosomal protein L17 [Candidatus Omnitrophica bacterium]|nr:50S ribosomal protein L17 [Candidatus Omnitrophota bacterium]